MKQKPPRGIGQTFARVQDKEISWLAVLSPPTLAYLAASLYFARVTQGASGMLGLTPRSAGAVLVDLTVATLPVLVLIACYMRYLARSSRRRREAFVSAYKDHALVRLTTAPATIYRLQDCGLQIVWNADGALMDGPVYPMPDTQPVPLDRDHFIAHGIP